jgi:F-type H+-transporting ATPase subunit b
MASEIKKASPAATLAMLVVGIGLMLGGMYVSKTYSGPDAPEATKWAFIDQLAHQGILLDLGKTIAVIGVFLILFKVIETFYLMPLREAIHERNSSLEATFGEADSLREEMAGMKAAYESRLAETEASARAEIQSEIAKAQELRRSLEAEARAKADEMARRANEEIAAERARALGDIRLHVANLTLQATERLLGENVDNEKNRKLIDEFIDKVEVPAG